MLEYEGGQLVIYRHRNFFDDFSLKLKLTETISSSYTEPSDIIDQEYATCNTLYVLENNHNIISFFFVNFHRLAIGGDERKFAFLGLSATSQKTKNSGIVRNLYQRLVHEVAYLEKIGNQPIFLWYTTASPSACYAAYNIFSDAEPRIDGSYSEYEEISTALKSYLNYPSSALDHPFVMRGFFPSRRYSDEERVRIEGIEARHSFGLLRDLNIKEHDGDRIMYICRSPSETIIPIDIQTAHIPNF